MITANSDSGAARRRGGILLGLCSWALCVAAPLCAAASVEQDPDPKPTPEEQAAARQRVIRSTFLKHFAQLVEWPDDVFDDEEAPFVLGIVGPDPLRRELDQVMEDLEIMGRRVQVRRFGRFADLEEPERLASCQVLLVAEPDPIVQGRIIETLSEAPTLLVSDAVGFADAGGGIQTFVAKNKPRFEVNRSALKSAGLRPSSKLLKLSRTAPKRSKLPERRREQIDSRSVSAGRRR